MHHNHRPRLRMTIHRGTTHVKPLTMAAGGEPEQKPGPVVEHRRPGGSSIAELMKKLGTK